MIIKTQIQQSEQERRKKKPNEIEWLAKWITCVQSFFQRILFNVLPKVEAF